MWIEHAGNSNYHFDSMKMKRSNTAQKWLHGKYGEAVNVWYCDLKLYYNTEQCTQYGQFREGTNIFFDYRYVKKSHFDEFEQQHYEAYQNRKFFVKNPDDYDGTV